jgi:hypothetical protein
MDPEGASPARRLQARDPGTPDPRRPPTRPNGLAARKNFDVFQYINMLARTPQDSYQNYVVCDPLARFKSLLRLRFFPDFP